MAWDKGFAFRGTSTYVTDAAPDTYVLGGEQYPITRNSCTFGFSASDTTGFDRDVALDPRLAGIGYDGFGSRVFRVDLPAAGTYKVRMAIGDGAGTTSASTFVIKDTSTTLLTVNAGAANEDEFIDATEVLRTAAAWPGSNAWSANLTFATTIFNLAFQAAGGSGGKIAYLLISQVGATATITGTGGAGMTEGDVVAGGKTIVITLTGGETFVA